MNDRVTKTSVYRVEGRRMCARAKSKEIHSEQNTLIFPKGSEMQMEKQPDPLPSFTPPPRENNLIKFSFPIRTT